jgi:hypothetical protein
LDAIPARKIEHYVARFVAITRPMNCSSILDNLRFQLSEVVIEAGDRFLLYRAGLIAQGFAVLETRERSVSLYREGAEYSQTRLQSLILDSRRRVSDERFGGYVHD